MEDDVIDELENDEDPELEDLIEDLKRRDEIHELLDSMTVEDAMESLGLSAVMVSSHELYEVDQYDEEVEEVFGTGRAPIRFGQPMCVSCGYSVFECAPHDEEALEVIRMHETGNHEKCDLDACPPDQREGEEAGAEG